MTAPRKRAPRPPVDRKHLAVVPDDVSPTVEQAPKRNKVALVGFTSSLKDAPWGDPDWELWPCNNLHLHIGDEWQKATAWFNLHRWDEIESDEPHVEWIEAGHMPVYLFDQTIRKATKAGKQFPTAVGFPADELREAFENLAGADYFTNSISWMIAFAILHVQEAGGEGQEIGLYGIDMAQGGEYAQQRPSCEYWLGVAEGAGIKVTIAETADLLKAHALYGLDDGSAFVAKIRERNTGLMVRLTDARGQHDQLLEQLQQNVALQNQILGALETGQYIEGVWLPAKNVRQGGADPYATTKSS